MAFDILFIEDNPADHELTERVLRQAGVLGASLCVDSAAALDRALAERRWDAIVSDYSVPGISFVETLGRVARDLPGTPLILLSATLGDAKAAVLLHLGASGYVHKSRLQRLAPLLERVLRRPAG